MRITDYHRLFLSNLYRDQIHRFGLAAWKRHAKKIVRAAHARLRINQTKE